MPYIPKEDREPIDLLLAPLIRELTCTGKWDMGLLNYVFTRILLGMKAERYSQYSSLRGVLADVSQEYYRRVMVPYENERKEDNGDVYA